MECHCCNAMCRAKANYTDISSMRASSPEVVQAGLDQIPSDHADPEAVSPSIGGSMARRAAEKGDSNLWKKEIHHPHKDLFIPANFSSSDHRFAVWAIKSGTHLMAAKWGKSHQHRCKVVFLEHGVPVEHTFFLMWTHSAVPCDSKGEDPCPAVNACLVPPGLIQDPPASWADESAICSMCKPHSWAEFEASKSLFAPCSTQVQQRLLTQC